MGNANLETTDGLPDPLVEASRAQAWRAGQPNVAFRRRQRARHRPGAGTTLHKSTEQEARPESRHGFPSSRSHRKNNSCRAQHAASTIKKVNALQRRTAKALHPAAACSRSRRGNCDAPMASCLAPISAKSSWTSSAVKAYAQGKSESQRSAATSTARCLSGGATIATQCRGHGV